MKKKIINLITGLLLLSLFSCSNLFTELKKIESKINENFITVGIKLPGNSTGRSTMFYTEDETSYYVVSLLKENDVIDSVKGLPGQTVNVKTETEGEYTFSVIAYKEDGTVIASGKKIVKLSFENPEPKVEIEIIPAEKEDEPEVIEPEVVIKWGQTVIPESNEMLSIYFIDEEKTGIKKSLITKITYQAKEYNGRYLKKWDCGTENKAAYTGYLVVNSDSRKEVLISGNGNKIVFNANCSELFVEMLDAKYAYYTESSELRTIIFDGIDTSRVTSMVCMFDGCNNLEEIDLSEFDTSNVTNMGGMFTNCSSLTQLDLSSFNTSKVTNMVCMFDNCSSLTQLDLSNFDTSNVRDMTKMFANCSSLTQLDLSNFNTSNVIHTGKMFLCCSNLTKIDLSSFDTSKVINMVLMFGVCSSLKTIDLSSFDTSNVYTMNELFSGCNNLIQLDLSNFDTSTVADMEKMFYLCSNLKHIYVSDKFSTKNVSNSNSMFSKCKNLPGFDSNKTDISAACIGNGGYFEYIE